MGLFDPGATTFAGLLAGKPDVPQFVPVDPQVEQQKAVQGNLAMAPNLQQLAGSFTQFNEAQIEKMLQASIPGYTSIKGDVSGNIESMLKGEIPSDVSSAVQRADAARSLGGGYGGTGAARNLTTRDLGLTSLDLTQKGISSAQSWLQTMNSLYAPGIVSPVQFSNMFISPAQQIATQQQERNAKFQHDWTSNVLDWQSSLGYLAGAEMSQTSGQFNNLMGTIVGNMFGGAAGAGGGAAVGGGL